MRTRRNVDMTTKRTSGVEVDDGPGGHQLVAGKAFPFYAECVKADGMVCPRCGSKDVYDWSKGENYYYDGGSCMCQKCDLG